MACWFSVDQLIAAALHVSCQYYNVKTILYILLIPKPKYPIKSKGRRQLFYEGKKEMEVQQNHSWHKTRLSWTPSQVDLDHVFVKSLQAKQALWNAWVIIL